ncbi:transcriptional regulator [Caviibacter abscessus]|uniref:transcriptional regulator n=1 Tax=Caviibacter abscessus TaxID=1766719 RepID=UPI00082A67D7|nr:transcriptional regulator [Caviibacter abscessus]
MSEISQTNRTILFEEINPNKNDLLTLIGDIENLESLSDDKIDEINKELLVSNFNEFLEKFEPTIYSYFDAKTNKISYTLQRIENIPDEAVNKIVLNENNSFFNMLLTLIDTRKSNKVKNINFNFEDILELLSPKKVIENIRQTRKEIHYLYNKYLNYDENDPARLEIGDKLNLKFENASKNYNNILSLLPLAIEDIKTRILLEENNRSKHLINRITPGILNIDNEGSLEILQISNNSELIQIEQNSVCNEELSNMFIEDYQENTALPSTYIANLISRTFVPLSKNITDLPIEKEVENYNNYLEIYKNSQEDFIKIAKELVKKLIGVKLFFQQYETKNAGMSPKLLITNINPNFWINTSSKKSLEIYLNTVNNKNDFNNTVWFGILPNIEMNNHTFNKEVKKRFKGTNKEDIEKIKFNTLICLSDILYKYKIQLFFNFVANEESNFKKVSTSGIDEYMELTKILENKVYSEYVIPVLPNFTLIPKNNSKVLLGNKLDILDTGIKKTQEIKFYIDGMYLDASYVAAGLVASYQCPEFLKDRFSNVLSDTPGVRINIEAFDNNFEIMTTMPKEISGYTNNVKNRINEAGYGFIFTSDNAVYNQKIIDNICVYKARSLYKNNQHSYEPIYKTLTCTYIERVLRYTTSDFKEDRINHFFSSSPDSKKSIWLKNSDYINSILTKKDDMTHIIDNKLNTCSLNLSFVGDVKHLELNINSKE